MKSRSIIKLISVCMLTLIAAVSVIFITSSCTKTSAEVKRSVPFSEVTVDDGLMHNYMKLVICNVIPSAISNVEENEDGGMLNIKNCARWHRGEIAKPEHKGLRFVDSDVHKVLESMCMALDTPDGGDAEIIAAQKAIKAKLEEWIPYFVDAQEKDGSQYPGYLDTYYSLDPDYEKYSYVDGHELYCQGHFIEAAVAHYRYSKHKDATPDSRLLDVAVRSADHIAKTFGTEEGQRNQVPGHQELELALMKLAKLCQEIGGPYADKAQSYIDKAAFFLEARGHDQDKRTADMVLTKFNREYFQDHQPVSQQTSAVGHAVRAQYMYTGMCELATIDSSYAQKYDNALSSLWNDLTNTKQYITGGMGDQSNDNEGFADPYFLPNYSSYCETCAGVANMLWNRSMSTLYDGTKYADQIENTLYNNVLGCINFDGNKFYYENRICTHRPFDRSEWFGCACCPPNFTRTILQLGGYVYNTTDNAIYVNQYISNTANFAFGDNNVNVSLKSGFPYDTSGSIVITPKADGKFSVNLRKPDWAKGYQISVNGQVFEPSVKDGYLVIDGQTWSTAGVKIDYKFDMELEYVKTDSRVKTNEGLVALRHGPLYYCAEGCDNDAQFDFNKASIDINGQHSFNALAPLDGMADHFGVCSVVTLNHSGKAFSLDGTRDITWKLIPYYARCNRVLGNMHLFFRDGSQEPKLHQKAVASASFTYKEDTVTGLNDGTVDPDMRWSSYNTDENVLPNPWVQYDFSSPVDFSGFRIWWLQGKAGSCMPNGVKVTVYNDQTGTVEEFDLTDESKVTVSDDGDFKKYNFNKSYTGNKIKLTFQNDKSAQAVAICEWELI